MRSVFDGFKVQQVERERLDRIVVTVGTRVGFRRLLERLASIIPHDVDVLWQTGASPLAGLPIEARPFMPAAELEAAIAAADVVVGHSGVGTALSSFRAGRCPVLVPREATYSEVVDDHQRDLADMLSAAGVAVTSKVDDLRWEHLVAASRRTIVEDAAARIDLEGTS